MLKCSCNKLNLPRALLFFFGAVPPSPHPSDGMLAFGVKSSEAKWRAEWFGAGLTVAGPWGYYGLCVAAGVKRGKEEMGLCLHQRG